MAEQTKASETLAQVIRDHYDLGEVEPPQNLAAAHQRRHRKLVVKTSAGRFLVKTYKNELTVLDNLRFQHRLADHLAKHRLPVARIQPARNGKRIVEVDTYALELQEFIEGIPMQVTAKTLAVSASALGKFHEVCRDIPRPVRDAQMWRFSEVPRDTFANLYERSKGEDPFAPVDDYCNTIALFLRDASNALRLEARNQFETGLIHGDWHGGNLLFVRETLTGILDLEFAGDGCYLEDLSYAISNLCVRTATDDQRLTHRTNILLDHYQRYRSLSPFEQKALYYAVGVKHVATVSYQSRQLDGKVAGHTPSEWMRRLSIQCEWLGKRAKEVKWGG